MDPCKLWPKRYATPVILILSAKGLSQKTWLAIWRFNAFSLAPTRYHTAHFLGTALEHTASKSDPRTLAERMDRTASPAGTRHVPWACSVSVAAGRTWLEIARKTRLWVVGVLTRTVRYRRSCAYGQPSLSSGTHQRQGYRWRSLRFPCSRGRASCGRTDCTSWESHCRSANGRSLRNGTSVVFLHGRAVRVLLFHVAKGRRWTRTLASHKTSICSGMASDGSRCICCAERNISTES